MKRQCRVLGPIVLGILLTIVSCGGGGGSSGGEDEAQRVPVTPDGLSAVPLSGSRIELRWLDRSDNETGFELARSTDGETFQGLRALDANTESLVDEGLSEEMTYFYQIRAVNSRGPSAWSGTAQAKTFKKTLASTFGGLTVDGFSDVVETEDGGWIVVGSTSSFGAGFGDAWVIRLDRDGRIVWENAYGGFGFDAAESIVVLDDDHYLIGGWTASFGAGDEDGWLIAIQGEGQVVWERAYGGTTIDVIRHLVRDGDQVWACGMTRSLGTGIEDGWLFEVSASDGQVQWEKAYGEAGRQDFRSLARASDGTMIVVGTSAVGLINPNFDGWVVRLDAQGGQIGEWTYGGSEPDGLSDVVVLADGRSRVVGSTGSFGTAGAWVLALHPDGQIEWQHTLSIPQERIHAVAIERTAGGGFVLGGGWITTNPLGSQNVWLAGLGSLGKPQWQVGYVEPNFDGLNTLVLGDSGIFMAATRANAAGTDEEAWFLRSALNGQIDFNPSSGLSVVVSTARVQLTTAAPLPSGAVALDAVGVVTDTNAVVTPTQATVNVQAP